MHQTDEEIRKKYSLPQDIPVLRRMPSVEESKASPSFLVKVADALGAKTWMWKTIGGVIIAIIVLPPKVDGIVDWWKPKFVSAYELVGPYARGLRDQLITFNDQIIGFSSTNKNEKDNFPYGTILAPSYELKVANDNLELNIWRIVNARYADNAYSVSPKPYGNKWFDKGSSVIYAMPGLMEAFLEFGLEDMRSIHVNLVAVRATLPSGVSIESISPHEYPNVFDFDYRASRQIADSWLTRKSSLILSAPSRFNAKTSIFLLNPMHPEFNLLTVKEIRSFDLTEKENVIS